MKNITDIKVSEGVEYISALLSQHVVVRAKKNIMQIGMHRTNAEGKDILVFTRGEDKTEISQLDTVLYSIYSPILSYLKEKADFYKLEFPDIWDFKFLYDGDLSATESFSPEKIILTCIKAPSAVYDNESLLSLWANRFGISFEKNMFDGFLNEFQKIQIIRASEIGFVPEPDFTSYMSEVLGSICQYDKADAFIFRCTDTSLKTVCFKISNNGSTEEVENKGTSHDTNNLLLSNFFVFLNSVDLSKYDIKGKDEHEAGISLMCALFNDYAEKETAFISGLTEGYSAVNMENIPDRKTREILSKDKGLSQVFQIIASKLLGDNNFVNKMNIPEDFSKAISDKITQIKDIISKSVSKEKNSKSKNKEKILSFDEFEAQFE